jgi:DNA modification methylase
VSLENDCKYDEEEAHTHTHITTRSRIEQNGIVFERRKHMKRDYNVRMREKRNKSHKNPSNKNDGSINCNRKELHTQKRERERLCVYKR